LTYQNDEPEASLLNQQIRSYTLQIVFMSNKGAQVMDDVINSRLTEIELDNQIKIVYACESGSRAWGFPSANSDYDVRFIYIRPIEWYLSIDEKRDVIEYPIDEDLDINGWDLKKALQLLQKTNPPLLEWLGSPIVYFEKFSVVKIMRELAKEYYSPSACLYHYLHMAHGNFREYLQGDIVWVKKYFYVLRPLLAMKWIEEGLGIVPTDFNVTLEKLALPVGLKESVATLIESKRSGNELDKGEKIPVISDFIESELERWENSKFPKSVVAPLGNKLNEFFRESIKEVW
jgi:predicted nucleotidyltransferase